MEIKEIESAIRFHKYGLESYSYTMSTGAIYFEKFTIEALERLKILLVNKE